MDKIGWDLSLGLHILTFFQTGHSPKRLRTALTFLALSVTGTSSAFATSILAKVHIAAHRLNVSVGGKPTYSWGIATARRGYHTPRGTYHVTAVDIDAYSWKYDAPMPYAVCFIRGDYWQLCTLRRGFSCAMIRPPLMIGRLARPQKRLKSHRR